VAVLRLAAYGGPVEGTPFGRYRLIEVLGHGGMGVVWRAHDPIFDRFVALKVLPANLADDQVFQQRFRQEALAAAGLDEPHIVPIYDFGEVEDRLFVTMRLIEGQSLETLIEAGPLEPARAVFIIEQIASALDAAHRVKLVHRDVKPSNILIADNDFAYLIDFGIARSIGKPGLTSTGATIGTWAYMAPERFRVTTPAPSSDTYALACVLHQSLTGQLPFPTESLEQILLAHIQEPPPKASSLRPALPAALDEVIATGMAKNPEQRYQTARDLASAARLALTSGPRPDEDTHDGGLPAGGGSAAETSNETLKRSRPHIAADRDLPADSASDDPIDQAAQDLDPGPARKRSRLVPTLMVAGVLAVIAAVALAVILLGDRGPAYRATATVPVGKYPEGVAVDPATRAVYVANRGDGTVSVIDGSTRAVTATVPVGFNPEGAAVDPGTHAVYVPNNGDGTVSIIDGSTHTVTATVPVGKYPVGVAVDPGTHTVYVPNNGDGTVSIIDGSTHTGTATVPVGKHPVAAAADPTTHTIYIPNRGDGTVSVIDGSTHTVTATVPVGEGPSGAAVDPGNHTIYVPNSSEGTVSVIDGLTRTVTATVPVGKDPARLAVDPSNHAVYVANYGDGTVALIEHR
jgi:serine/threonine protein kinase, bacterial